MKPVLFVTGNAPAYRVGALARLHEREQIELALFGGRSQHAGADYRGELPFPHRRVRPSTLVSLAASGRYRAVVCPTGGRVAPLATWAGARRGGVPLILWASLWAHPRSVAHALSYVPLRRLYRSADAVVTYGPHVSAYVSARGARNVHIAPQSVDNEFWSSPDVSPPSDPGWPADAEVRFLFVGRPSAAKGVPVLVAAWRAARLTSPRAALLLAGVGSRSVLLGGQDAVPGSPIVCLDPLEPVQLRDVYAACDVLVVPSIPTPHLSRALGVGCQRGYEPGSCRNRHRCCGSRRRRPGARRRKRAGCAGGRSPRACRRHNASRRGRDPAQEAGRGRRPGRECIQPRRLGAGILSRALQRRRLRTRW